MNVSVDLPDDLVAQISHAGAEPSAFVAEAVRRLLQERRESASREDISRIDEFADELNREAAEVLEFQAFP